AVPLRPAAGPARRAPDHRTNTADLGRTGSLPRPESHPRVGTLGPRHSHRTPRRRQPLGAGRPAGARQPPTARLSARLRGGLSLTGYGRTLRTTSSGICQPGGIAMKSRAHEQALKHVRALCLVLPETHEVEAWGHPTFRAGKKMFAAFGEGEDGLS